MIELTENDDVRRPTTLERHTAVICEDPTLGRESPPKAPTGHLPTTQSDRQPDITVRDQLVSWAIATYNRALEYPVTAWTAIKSSPAPTMSSPYRASLQGSASFSIQDDMA
jgi:hypothetical protein